MRTFLWGLPLLMLGACSEGPKTPEQAAEEMASAPKLRPGLWRTDFRFVDVEMPSLPPRAREMMKTMLEGRSDENCVTPEEANRDPREFLTRVQQQSGCRYDRFEVSSAGALDARMICAPPAGTSEGLPGNVRTEAEMKGTIAPELIDMTITSATTGIDSPVANAKMTMTMKSARVGECT